MPQVNEFSWMLISILCFIFLSVLLLSNYFKASLNFKEMKIIFVYSFILLV